MSKKNKQPGKGMIENKNLSQREQDRQRGRNAAENQRVMDPGKDAATRGNRKGAGRQQEDGSNPVVNG